jgi:hypothetical protein
VLARAKQAVDADTAGNLAESKRRMAAYDRAIQKAVKVAPESIADDVEPLGKMWADIDRDVQQARSAEELAAATQSGIADRQAAYQRASATVSAYVDAHCTTSGGTK